MICINIRINKAKLNYRKQLHNISKEIREKHLATHVLAVHGKNISDCDFLLVEGRCTFIGRTVHSSRHFGR